MDDQAKVLGDLEAIAKAVSVAEQRLTDLRGRRDHLIRAAVDVGVPRRRIALAAQVTRNTVYAAAPTT